MTVARDLLLIYAAAFLRAVGVALTGVILAIYLSHRGLSASAIGAVVTAGLAGSALATLAVSFWADSAGRRLTLAGLSILGALGGGGMAMTAGMPWIAVVAFMGMMNGMGRDRGPAVALEQAIIPGTASAERRTWALASYNVVLAAGHAVGALAGALPFLLRRWTGASPLASYQATFFLYAVVFLLSGCLYLFLSRGVEVARVQSALAAGTSQISPESKRLVRKLAALFGLDSLGGGFLTGALIAYWFFRRFGVTEESLGLLFFAMRGANAASYFVAAWLSRHIGLVNTMVFTHIPSSLILMAVPFAPTFAWAVVLMVLRECLSQMDVPTRQSYLMAVVEPNERSYASGITSLVRNAAWATAPSVAGTVMQHLALAAPLFIGGGIKIAYDLLLYGSFRRLKPPEERVRAG